MSVTQVQTTGIENNAVTSAKIPNGAVGTTEIANDAVTAAKIANGAVGTTEIANDAVTSDKMGSGSVSILHESNAGSNSINLTLDSGTWFVEFHYRTFVSSIFNQFPPMDMVIDNTVVQTTPFAFQLFDFGYVPIFGATYVSGSRTINCYITNVPSQGEDLNLQRCMVKATRIY